MSLLTAII